MKRLTMNRYLRIRALIFLAVVLYGLAYLSYRRTHVEVWVVDGHEWLIFGSATSYYLFRPLCYLDGWITGMRFHIGPHQQPDPDPPG